MNKFTLILLLGIITNTYCLTQTQFNTCLDQITNVPTQSQFDDCDHLGEFYTEECDYIEVTLLADSATWDATYTQNYKDCLDAIYSYQDIECNHQSILDYYDDVAACVDSQFLPDENYFTSSSDYFADYTDSIYEDDYQDCIDQEYADTTASTTEIDDCDYFLELTENEYSDACWYVDQNAPASTAEWTDKYRRMNELCQNDIAFWLDENCNSQAAIDYYTDVSDYCLDYLPVDPNDVQGINDDDDDDDQNKCTGKANSSAQMTNDMYESCLTSVNNNLTAAEAQLYLDCDVEGYGVNNSDCKYIASHPPTCDYSTWSTTYGKKFYNCQVFYSEQAAEKCSAEAEAVFIKMQECVEKFKRNSGEILRFVGLALIAFLLL